MTEHQQIFYDGREEDTTFLRVHGIPAVMSFLDYSAAATGMTYRNNNNPAGVTIDGVADSVAAGPLTWESVDGAQGALTSIHTWSTTVAASKFTSFYRDLASPPAGQAPCQGDGGFYGASGPYVNGSINSTDEPANGSAPADRLTSTRTLFFDAPGTANGALRRQQVSARLTTNVDPAPPCGASDRWQAPGRRPARDRTARRRQAQAPSSSRCVCATAALAAARGARPCSRSRVQASTVWCVPACPSARSDWPRTARGPSGWPSRRSAWAGAGAVW